MKECVKWRAITISGCSKVVRQDPDLEREYGEESNITNFPGILCTIRLFASFALKGFGLCNNHESRYGDYTALSARPMKDHPQPDERTEAWKY
jgi:hypothetical protein